MVGRDAKLSDSLSSMSISTFRIVVCDQFDMGFPGLKVRECKYYERHQETLHFICCLKF